MVTRHEHLEVVAKEAIVHEMPWSAGDAMRHEIRSFPSRYERRHVATRTYEQFWRANDEPWRT